MIDLNDCYMLGENFHTNKFRILFNRKPIKNEDEADTDFEDRKASIEKTQVVIEENLCITTDGTIVGIRKSVADRFLKDSDVEAVRWGRKKFPERLEIKEPDDLYKLLSSTIPLDETI